MTVTVTSPHIVGIVRRVGELLDVDMDDHDLSKSRIVQIALGFLWHWPSAREVNDQLSHMKKLALDAVHAGHLEVETITRNMRQWGLVMLMFANSLQTDFRCTCKRMFMMDKKAGGSISIYSPTISG